MTPTLELRKVSRVHGTGRTKVDALVDASLVVTAGELVAVMGPSGSGKTTLLSLAGGLERPTSGEVLVEATPLSRMSAGRLASLRRRKVGYVFQQFNLIEGLTAAENVSVPLELDGVGRRAARRAAMEALDDLGLSELADRFPDELSGGEQQRVAIARAVVGDRVLLLADEPTGALDTVRGEEVLRLLRRHCERGGAGVLVTHDARLAAWAERVVFLRDGRIVDETAPRGDADALLDSVQA
ncbi:MAG TPA: ABC transporter ATP-binding protein [Actinomycetota bacterium]|nr:ABC transporter ATP-binding protein [Actinomycetota bacterium]